MTFNPFNLGAALAASRHGKTVHDLNKSAGFVETVESNELFCRGLCKMASAIYEADGSGSSVNGIAFRNLAKNDTEWKRGYTVFSDAVLRAVGRHNLRMEKEAVLAETVMIPSVLKSLNVTTPIQVALATGLLAGTTGGAGMHLLSRGTRQTSDENEELLQKAREYRRLRQEIDEDISNSVIEEGGSNDRHSL